MNRLRTTQQETELEEKSYQDETEGGFGFWHRIPPSQDNPIIVALRQQRAPPFVNPSTADWSFWLASR